MSNFFSVNVSGSEGYISYHRIFNVSAINSIDQLPETAQQHRRKNCVNLNGGPNNTEYLHDVNPDEFANVVLKTSENKTTPEAMITIEKLQNGTTIKSGIVLSNVFAIDRLNDGGAEITYKNGSMARTSGESQTSSFAALEEILVPKAQQYSSAPKAGSGTMG